MAIPFSFQKTSIPGLIKIAPFYAEDLRGGFLKDYSWEIFSQNGYDYSLAEVFYTLSHRGVMRGLHFQRIKPQAKLVRCLRGHIYDVVLDLREKSPAFKKWLGFDLTGDNRQELLIPGGCAHGYLVIEDSIVSYKCEAAFYAPGDDGILFDDPELGITWPFESIGGKCKLIIAQKDLKLQSLKKFCEQKGGWLYHRTETNLQKRTI